MLKTGNELSWLYPRAAAATTVAAAAEVIAIVRHWISELVPALRSED